MKTLAEITQWIPQGYEALEEASEINAPKPYFLSHLEDVRLVEVAWLKKIATAEVERLKSEIDANKHFGMISDNDAESIDKSAQIVWIKKFFDLG